MNPEFREAVESLHSAFELLIGADPYTAGTALPEKGVYVFYENGKALYVGRSNNIPQRRRQHIGRSSQTTQAALATLIARKETGRKVDYRKGARERLLSDHEFMHAFRNREEASAHNGIPGRERVRSDEAGAFGGLLRDRA